MTDTEFRIWELVEAAALAATDEDGVFFQKVFVDEIKARLGSEDLPPNVRALTAEVLATLLAQRFVRGRTPKKRGQTLFSPGFILPLGGRGPEAKRQWMDKATADDLILWAAQDSANLSKVAAASADKQSYVAERLVGLKEHPGWSLGRLERDVFGWVEPEMDDRPDDDPFGDENEDGA